MRRWALLYAASILLLGCGAQSDPAADHAAGATGEGCPDGGPRLPGTGVCMAAAGNYLNVFEPVIAQPPQGCRLEPRDVMLAPDRALMFIAVACDDGPVPAYRFEARGDVLMRIDPARPAEARPVLQMTALFARTPTEFLHFRLEQLPVAERVGCVVGPEPNASERLAIAPPPARVKQLQAAGLSLAVCGPEGVSADGRSYWTFGQDYAWRWTLGPDPVGFDPASVTLIRKDSKGDWVIVPR